MAEDAHMRSAEWNYHPELPLKDPSIFKWPPRAGFLARWFAANWLTLSERVIMVLLAVIAWLLFYPSLEAAHEFALGWILQTWAVNMGLMLAIGGGLHWYFYMRKGQGQTLKFDRRDQARGNRLWKFSDQVHDNMFWSLGSGVAQLTAFQVVTMWLMANGYAPTITLASNPLWFVLALILLPIWSAFHFYWVHRLLHVPFLYRKVHSLHHRNVNIGPWSGLSMHPVEHLIFFSAALIHFVIPAHPLHILFHLQHQALTAASSHTGYENLLIRDRRRLALGTFHHQMHHRYFEVNYGNLEMPWDKWFGSFHDGTPEAHSRLKGRRQRRG